MIVAHADRRGTEDGQARLKTDRSRPTADEIALRRYFDKHVAGGLPRLFWYLRLLPGAAKQTALYGASAAQATGRSVPALFLDCVRTCVDAAFWPAGYYRMKLYEKDRRVLAKRFISARVAPGVLNRINDREDAEVLDDKVRFASACKRAGLPHVDTVAYFEDGKLVEGDGGTPESLPRCNLFVKSTNLLCGRGVERWEYDRNHGAYVREGQTSTASELLEHVRALSERGVDAPLWMRMAVHVPRLMNNGERALQQARPYLVQRELQNHPDMARFSNGALCTVRVVTGRAAGGPVKPLTAALRMPTGDSPVDNFAAGGLAAPIDLETGLLGRAVYKDPRVAEVDSHPDSGARITGEILPIWEEARALAMQAHETFRKVAAVGWDLAFTTDGPRLLEANPNWCVEVVQMAHGQPLGETELPAMLMSNAGSPPERSLGVGSGRSLLNEGRIRPS